jgi:hypothetical protein
MMLAVISGMQSVKLIMWTVDWSKEYVMIVIDLNRWLIRRSCIFARRAIVFELKIEH